MIKEFSIIIPVFNEEDNISKLIEEIKISLKTEHFYEIIIINDGSYDNTKKILNNINEDNLIIFNLNKNYGQSYSLHYGINKAKYDNIVTIDGDLQNDPKDINKLLDIYFSNKNLKLVSGIRRNRKDTFIKIVSSKLANSIRSKFLNDNCPDTGCSLKIFQKNIFLKIEFFNGLHRFIPTFFENMDLKVKYIDVNHRRRVSGISKYGTFDRLYKGIKDLIKVKKLINRINK